MAMGLALAQPVRVLSVTVTTEQGVTLSPDGKTAAFADTGGDIHVRSTPNGHEAIIKGTTAAGQESITYVPNDGFIYFWGRWAALYRVSLASPTPSRLIENVALMSFSPDGKKIAFMRTKTIMFEASTDGTGQRQLATWPCPVAGLAWYSDSALAVLLSKGGGLEGLATVSDATGDVKELASWQGVANHLIWSQASGGLLMLRYSNTGRFPDYFGVWHYSLPGGQWTRLTDDNASYQNLRQVSADAAATIVLATRIRRANSFWEELAFRLSLLDPYKFQSDLVQLRIGK